MAGIVKSRFEAIAKVNGLPVFDLREKREAGLGLSYGIKRDLGIWTFASFTFVSFAFIFGILFLYMCSIQ